MTHPGSHLNITSPTPKRTTPPSGASPFIFNRASTTAMAVHSSLFYFLVLFCVLSTVRAQSLIVVRVDPVSGNDSSCYSAQEAGEAAGTQPDQACATINRALGNVGCGGNASCAPSDRDQLSGVEIRLADGIHRLTGGLFTRLHQFKVLLSSCTYLCSTALMAQSSCLLH
jgi:hypothetical protein